MGRQSFKALVRPAPHGLARAGVNDDLAAVHHPFAGRKRRQVEVERMSQGGPVLRPMGMGGTLQWATEQEAGTGAGKAEAMANAGEGQQEMVARIRPGGNARSEGQVAQRPHQRPELAPGPVDQAVLATECGPGGVEWNQFDARGKMGKEGRGVGFAHERNPVAGAGGAKERDGQSQVADSPQLEHEQTAWIGGS